MQCILYLMKTTTNAAPLKTFPVNAFVYVEPSKADWLTEEQKWEGAGVYVVIENANEDVLLEEENTGNQYWFSRRSSRIRLGR